jgi:hypothetical protein
VIVEEMRSYYDDDIRAFVGVGDLELSKVDKIAFKACGSIKDIDLTMELHSIFM